MVEENWLDEVEYKYVVGQDPGGTTGVAVLRYTEDTPPELVYLHQIADGREGFFYFFVGTDVGEGTDFVSVSEKWETREGVHGANLEPAYIEGVQYAIWINQTIYQSPSVKSMIGDEFLKLNNLWTEGKRHQMDALLHALYYLRSIGHKPTLQALANKLADPLAEPGEADEKTLPGGDTGEGEEDGQGDGDSGDSGEPGSKPARASGVAGAADALARAIQQLEESAKETAKAVEDLADSLEDGQSGSDNSGDHSGVEAVGTGKAREEIRLNGAFMGYDFEYDE